MNNKGKISVVLNTYNAERHLERVIEAVKGFDEVLVCDMESTDHTREIAAKMDCRVVFFPKGDYKIAEPARDYAIHEAKYEWVLVVDADEIVTTKLREYLYEVAENPNAPDGISIPRKNFFMGRFMHSFYPDYVLRFFRRDKTHWPPFIHSQPVIDGTVVKIPHSQKDLALVHLAHDLIRDVVAKTNSYTDSELDRRTDKDYGALALFGRPTWRFFRSYILKQGYKDGMPGLIHAVLDAVYQAVLVAKVIEKKYKAH